MRCSGVAIKVDSECMLLLIVKVPHLVMTKSYRRKILLDMWILKIYKTTIAASPVATWTNRESQDHVINVTCCKNMAAFFRSTLHLSPAYHISLIYENIAFSQTFLFSPSEYCNPSEVCFISNGSHFNHKQQNYVTTAWKVNWLHRRTLN